MNVMLVYNQDFSCMWFLLDVLVASIELTSFDLRKEEILVANCAYFYQQQESKMAKDRAP